jgi:ABC-type glycerol-3-phosphate transport system substrate-binding protein
VKHRIATLGVACLAALTLTTGCLSGSGGPPPASENTGSQEGPVNLTFSSYALQEPTIQATQEIVDSWNAANPNIQVEYQKVDPGSVHDKLVTQFAGNSAPDVIHDEAADIAGFSRQGYLADLGPLIPDELRSDVPESVWKSVTVDGKVAGVPTIAQVYAVFVNTKALEEAGIALPTADAPWTWDDLASNAKKLTKGDESGFAWGLKSPTAGIQSAGLAFGGTFFSGDEAAPQIEVGAEELEVPNRLKAMLDDKSMAASSISLSGSEVLPGFFAGKYKMIMAGNYVATQINEKQPSGFEWTMLPLLKGTSQAQLSNPQTLSVARQSEHPEQAMQFIAYYNQAENLAKIAKGDALIPVTTSAAEIVKQDLGSQNGWDVILGSSANLVDAPWLRADKFPQWKTETATPAYQEFLAGRIDSATLAKRLTDGWNKANA